ncbi:hypothetical protein ACFQDM_06120 [Ponticaulis profundi]|uniref:Uncharacterized protein n=1 Tax=Ponticaulis profundi TaxID=2665222 RepID=A0ABW1S7K3_9PROT
MDLAVPVRVSSGKGRNEAPGSGGADPGVLAFAPSREGKNPAATSLRGDNALWLIAYVSNMPRKRKKTNKKYVRSLACRKKHAFGIGPFLAKTRA